MAFRGRALLVSCLFGCSFDATGNGTGPLGPAGTDAGTQPASTSGAESSGGGVSVGGTGESGSGDAAGSGGSTESGAVEGTDDGTAGPSTAESSGTGATGDSSSGSGGTSGGTSGTTGAACPDPVVLVLAAEDADVTAPMMSQGSPGEGTVLLSRVADAGSAEFEFDVPCAGTYRVWGRVLDRSAGPGLAGDPDSYFVRIDGGDRWATWVYGCTTTGPARWSWQTVAETDPLDCAQTTLEVDLDAGLHTVEFRNREPENAQGHFAALADVVLTNDPTYSP